MKVNIYKATTRLSRLIEEAASGRDVIIARVGRRVARLTRLAGTGGNRRLGVLDGRFRIPRDFNRPLAEEIRRAFEGV